MRRIKIILMLSMIIPSLDCCSSRTLFLKKPIHFYRAVELSMQKSTQFQQNDPQQVAPPPQSALPPQLPTTGDDQTYTRHHHLHYEEESGDEGENLKLNRSQRSDLLNKETDLDQNFEEKYAPGKVFDDNNDGNDQDVNSKQSSTIAASEKPVADGPDKLSRNRKLVSIECFGGLRLEFCLNGGRCFLYPILNESLTSCECADGYMGERCENKRFDLAQKTQPSVSKTIGGPFVFGLAVFDILFLLFLFCKNYNRD